jgi:polyhydroxybutyrate depolymerase
MVTLVASIAMPALATADSTTLTLSYQGDTRDSVIHLPAQYDPAAAYPLMLVFHSNGGTGAAMERISNFDTVADQSGFIVAYPDSVGAEWVLSGQNSDVGFTMQLIQSIESAYHVDPTRIYVSGYSQGAGLAQQVGFCDPTVVAGVADVAENLNPGWQSVCRPSAPLTYVEFHGTGDPISPYYGGSSATGTIYSSQQTATTWAQVDGCPNITYPASTTFPDTLSDGSSVTDTLEAWGSCAQNTTVAFFTITGGGHTWPGGAQNGSQTNGLVSEGLNGSGAIWQILSASTNPQPFAGVCGAANGTTSSSAPAAGSLCSIGLGSAVSGSGPWHWTCSGYNTGAAASCSAANQ